LLERASDLMWFLRCWGANPAGRRHGGAGDMGGPAEHQPVRPPQ
jgi:hypothetical protein